MAGHKTDRDWEEFGKDDPYFSVLTHDKFRRSNLTEDSKTEFFKSGEDHIDHILKRIRQHVVSDYSICRALDFGCGVGRLVIPLAKIAENVTGVDVSESMLREAKENCDVQSIKNANFFKSEDNLTFLEGKFNFIHSFIVFQHIPIKRGEHIFKKLIEKLEDGGICVAHFTYAKNHTFNKSELSAGFLRNCLSLAKNIINELKKKVSSKPEMQMNNYDLNKLFFMIQKVNVCKFYIEFTDHGGELGVIFYFQKPKNI